MPLVLAQVWCVVDIVVVGFVSWLVLDVIESAQHHAERLLTQCQKAQQRCGWAGSTTHDQCKLANFVKKAANRF
jgi:hypothetical protein